MLIDDSAAEAEDALVKKIPLIEALTEWVEIALQYRLDTVAFDEKLGSYFPKDNNGFINTMLSRDSDAREAAFNKKSEAAKQKYEALKVAVNASHTELLAQIAETREILDRSQAPSVKHPEAITLEAAALEKMMDIVSRAISANNSEAKQNRETSSSLLRQQKRLQVLAARYNALQLAPLKYAASAAIRVAEGYMGLESPGVGASLGRNVKALGRALGRDGAINFEELDSMEKCLDALYAISSDLHSGSGVALDSGVRTPSRRLQRSVENYYGLGRTQEHSVLNGLADPAGGSEAPGLANQEKIWSLAEVAELDSQGLEGQSPSDSASKRPLEALSSSQAACSQLADVIGKMQKLLTQKYGSEGAILDSLQKHFKKDVKGLQSTYTRSDLLYPKIVHSMQERHEDFKATALELRLKVTKTIAEQDSVQLQGPAPSVAELKARKAVYAEARNQLYTDNIVGRWLTDIDEYIEEFLTEASKTSWSYYGTAMSEDYDNAVLDEFYKLLVLREKALVACGFNPSDRAGFVYVAPAGSLVSCNLKGQDFVPWIHTGVDDEDKYYDVSTKGLEMEYDSSGSVDVFNPERVSILHADRDFIRRDFKERCRVKPSHFMDYLLYKVYALVQNFKHWTHTAPLVFPEKPQKDNRAPVDEILEEFEDVNLSAQEVNGSKGSDLGSAQAADSPQQPEDSDREERDNSAPIPEPSAESIKAHAALLMSAKRGRSVTEDETALGNAQETAREFNPRKSVKKD